MRRLSEQDSSLYLRRCSQVLNILSNAKRLEVVLTLLKGERSVTQLAHQIDLSQSALSQHLAKCERRASWKQDATDLLSIIASRCRGSAGYWKRSSNSLKQTLKKGDAYMRAGCFLACARLVPDAYRFIHDKA